VWEGWECEDWGKSIQNPQSLIQNPKSINWQLICINLKFIFGLALYHAEKTYLLCAKSIIAKVL
jgi:hypothetical protein